jgi:indole-3-glycerol phosphate synthase
MNILDRIRSDKLREVEERRSGQDEDSLKSVCADLPPPRGFASTVLKGRPPEGMRQPGSTLSVIAEIKKASPSVGVIREDFDPVRIACSYAEGGADCVSCLTDEPYFMGSIEYLARIREAVSLPILRKDFMLDTWQVWEARQAGADAILLIAGFVEEDMLRRIRDTAAEAGLDVLVEIHHEDELEMALRLDPDVLGINNRNLRTENFVTDISTTLNLVSRVPRHLALISESGIRNHEDVRKLESTGLDGILVGEHLMKEPDPGRAIRERLGLGHHAS